MSNYKGLETAGILVAAAILLSLFVVLPASAVVAKSRDNNMTFMDTARGSASKRHKKRRKSKSKKTKIKNY